jgi:hypothetical protein
MRLGKALVAAPVCAALAWAPTHAAEPGGFAEKTYGGALINASAGVPPEGIYMFNLVFAQQANLAGPITKATGINTGVQFAAASQGFLFVPGWTFLGATYDAVLAPTFAMSSVGSPVNDQASGMYNTYIVPVELAWTLWDSGFHIKTGLGMYIPDGTINGHGGLGSLGSPFWTFQPELIVSYLKDGFNLSAAVYEELNTANSITGYRSGNILHADFTATKTIGKWTLGPVGYYVGQVSNDKSSAFDGFVLGAQRFNILAAGGLVGYDFGTSNLTLWAAKQFSAKASGATVIGGVDTANATQGLSVLANLSFRLWGPEETSSPRMPLIHQ